MNIYRVCLLFWLIVSEFALAAYETLLETFFYSQRWYRKSVKGKWNLLCFNKRVFWSRENNFVDATEDLDMIVDVIKTEDWG